MPIFSRFGADFFHGLRRFFTVYKGHKRWSFSRFTPSRTGGCEAQTLGFREGPTIVLWEGKAGTIWQSLILPPSFPFRPCSLSQHFSPLHLHLYPLLYFDAWKTPFRYPSDLGTLYWPAGIEKIQSRLIAWSFQSIPSWPKWLQNNSLKRLFLHYSLWSFSS